MHQVVTNTDILEANEQMADHNRGHFKDHGVYVVNLMSAPGAGKTSVLEETIRRLRNDYGLGVIEHGLSISPASVRPGDAILLSGDIGRHGIAIMAAREGLSFEREITSDCAPLAGLISALIEAGIEIHCLRDLTRGGLASALVEIAEVASVNIKIDEIAIPVREDVRGACEILGFDPLYLANEGRFVAFVASPDAERALSIMSSHPFGSGASIIGDVASVSSAIVTLKSRIGGARIIDMLTGEQLPRIC